MRTLVCQTEAVSAVRFQLPPLAELTASARVVALPLVNRFRGITTREAMLFEGPNGWSEFSPFVEYDDEEASIWLAGSIDFGWGHLPTPLRQFVPVNATIPTVATRLVPEILSRFPGCRTAKVKVASPEESVDDDVARVGAVRDALGPEGRIRVDANGLWNLDEAEHAIHALAQFDLEYVEQPCASIDELAELRRRTKYMGVPIAADESVRKTDDPLRVARSGAADLLVIKAQPLGGVNAALRIVREAGLPVVVSSALDTSIGLAMGAHLAACIPELEYDCGLGTSALFTHDVTLDALTPVDGVVAVRRVAPDVEILDNCSAPEQRRQWWLNRLGRCHAMLTALNERSESPL